MWDLGLSQKAILVTGGSSGIGKAIATQVAKEGGRVCIVARDKAKLHATLSSLPGTDHVGISWDLTETDALEKLAEQVGAKLWSLASHEVV